MDGSEVRKIRKALGEPQWKFAERFDTSQNAVSTWERGKIEPPDHAIEIMEELSEKIDWDNLETKGKAIMTGVCIWTSDRYGWWTTCEEALKGTEEAELYKFCPFCGRHVKRFEGE